MIFTNRIINVFKNCVLLFILIASSIPNIYANTNPENPAPLEQAQKTDSISIQEKNDPKPAESDLINQDPVEFQLNVLVGMCEHILESLENGKWNLPHDESQKKLLHDVALDTFSAGCHLLKTFKDKKPDIDTQYLYTFVARHQFEFINNILLRKSLDDFDLEAKIKALYGKEKNFEELAQLIMQTNEACQNLYNTLQDLDALNTPTELTDSRQANTAKKEGTALDRTNDQVLKQLCIVDAILEELALFIDNNSLKVKDKAKAFNAIRQVRAIVEDRKKDSNKVTHATIYDLLTLNKYLIAHVRAMINSDFNNVPELDEKAYNTRTKRDIILEELNEKYQDNEIKLAELRAESQTAGLKNYHIFFRTLEPYWSKTLDGGRRILWPSLGLMGTGLMAHWSGTWPKDWQNWDFKIPFTQTWFFGQPWASSTRPPEVANRGFVGNITNVGPHLVTNPVIMAPITMAAIYGASDFKLMKKTASEYLAKLSNFLLGRKEVQNHTNLTHVEPKYAFKDVIGQQEIKNTLSTIVRYFEDPQGIDNRGLKLEKGYLFTGKTRSGKSFMAEALAGEIRNALRRSGKDEKTFKFIVAPADILRQSGGFHACMEHARRYAPCILFIDEIHLLDLQAGKNNALLGEFLTELSGCMSNNPEERVFVIAATNHEDALDKALRQSGRLSKEIRFEYPTYADRRSFTVNILEKRTINVQSDKWSRAINQFARETEDCTYEDLRKIIEDAFITAKFNGESIEPDDLNSSFDKNIRGIITVHDHEISEQERHIVAAHQAGYVLATKILAPHLSIAKVTTQPIREGIKERSLWSQWNEKNEDQKNDRVVHGKMFTYGKKTRDMLVTTQEQINACMIALSGYAAGNVQLGAAHNSSSYLPEKRQEAFNIVKMAIAKGVNIDEFNDTLKHEFLKRALVLRSACEAKAVMLMEKNKEVLNALYKALLRHGTLSGHAIDTILAQYQLNDLEFDQNMLNLIELPYANA